MLYVANSFVICSFVTILGRCDRFCGYWIITSGSPYLLPLFMSSCTMTMNCWRTSCEGCRTCLLFTSILWFEQKISTSIAFTGKCDAFDFGKQIWERQERALVMAMDLISWCVGTMEVCVLVPPSKALKFKYFSGPFPPHHYTEKIKSQKEITNWEQQHSFHYEHQM